MTTILNFSPSKLLNPATDELKLISLSQQGDAEAFARLYACYVSSDTRAAQRKERNPMRQVNGEAARETGYAFEAQGEQT